MFMFMFRLTVLLAAVVWVQPARADFVLTGNEHLEVNSYHGAGMLFDSSTADVLIGGSIAMAYVNDEALLRVLAGSVTNLYAYDTSSVNMSGGTIGVLEPRDASTVDISGGSISGYLSAYDTSSVNISGGKIWSYVDAYGTSSVDISGGSVGGLIAHHTSSVNISGGKIVYSLSAYDTSSVTFYGYDFRVTGGLRLEDERVLGTGVLIGKWFDETPWVVTIPTNQPGATIMAVPEPSTLTLLAIAAAGLLAWVWRRREW